MSNRTSSRGVDALQPDVALITPFPWPGHRHAGFSGVASYSANLAGALAATGATVHVVAERSDQAHAASPATDSTATEELHGSIRVTRAFRRGPGALLDAARAALDIGAATTHVQLEMFLYGGPLSLMSLPAALGLLRANGQGPIVTLHQVLEPATIDRATVELHRVPVPPSVARLGIGGLQRLVGQLAANTIVHEAPFAPQVPRSVVVPHGIETLPIPPRDVARRELGLADDRLTVLCFGFVAPYKGLELVLEAGEAVGYDVEVVVAGGEHPRLAGRDAYARALRDRHGHHARFTGWVPEADVSRWFAAADLAAYPYPKPFSASGSLALALAHRTPILVSPPMARCVGAPSELVMPTRPAALAEVLRSLTDQPDRLKAMAAWSDTLGVDRTWDAVARRHLDIYKEVSDARGPARRRLRASQPG
jgi:glycosyltransferase involved in cell wall biosynthesis